MPILLLVTDNGSTLIGGRKRTTVENITRKWKPRTLKSACVLPDWKHRRCCCYLLFFFSFLFSRRGSYTYTCSSNITFVMSIDNCYCFKYESGKLIPHQFLSSRYCVYDAYMRLTSVTGPMYKVSPTDSQPCREKAINSNPGDWNIRGFQKLFCWEAANVAATRVVGRVRGRLPLKPQM